jgi:hypothetical protein
MTIVCLYDAVTLRHFGTIERLEILAARCLYLDRPLDHSRSKQSDITGDTHLRLRSDIN